ncbi:MAG: Gfo/Idh/MocA family oxidoreductase, partial [Candidatus Glassbacteria bacterium]
MPASSTKLAWGIIAAGKIARKFSRGVQHSLTGRLAAVAARDLERAHGFAREFDIPAAYGSYQELIEDPAVEAVYVATPHPLHAEWAIAAARAGKHVLCEKPLAMNRAQAERVVAAARENDVFLMEAFMYRCHPQTARLVELVASGRIGEVRAIRATFSYLGTYDLASLKLDKKLGGGGILDVGCYPVSLCRLVAGVAQGKAFAEPENVQGVAFIGRESGVDEYAAATLTFPGGIIAQCACGVQLQMDNQVLIFGTRGRIEVAMPWFCSGIEGGTGHILVLDNRGDLVEDVEITTDRWLYAIE